MKVSNFIVKRYPKTTRYSAIFTMKSGLRKTLWFEVDSMYSKNVAHEDAFFVCAAPMAMALEEDLYFEGTVSTKLYNNIFKIKPYINEKNSKIQIYVKAVQKRETVSTKNGLLFSLGTDSLYSLLRNKDLKKADKINYLIFINGTFDFRLTKKVFAEAKKSVNEVARKTKTKAIFISTNVREVADSIINWSYFHGAAIASAALLTSSTIKKVYISNCDDYLKKNAPWGTLLELDKLWSTESVKVVSIWPTKKRLTKIAEIVKMNKKSVLKHIWVCFQRTDRFENCGRCEKCISISYYFKAFGIKEPVPGFKKINPEDIYKLDVHGDDTIRLEITTAMLKKQLNTDQELIVAMEDFIARKKTNSRAYKREKSYLTFKKNLKKKLIQMNIFSSEEALYFYNRNQWMHQL